MDQLLLILVAGTVAALAWGVVRIMAAATGGQKRKLHQRLSAENRPDTFTRANRPILLHAEEITLTGLLGRFAPLQIMQRRLAQAFPETRLSRFLIIVGAVGGMTGSIAWLLSGSDIAGAVLGAAGAYIPFFVVSSKRARRQKQITQQLPEALDFLSRVLRAGQSFSTGLQMMSEELPQPLAGEFRRCYDQHSLGQAIEDGLREMAIRLESPDFAFFATAVVIQRQSGGDMAEVLNNISHMIRQRLRLQQSVKAKTAEGRFTGYIMVAFPVVMFVLAWMLNPQYGNVLLHTGQGHVLLGVAAGLQMFGLFLIRKITTVRV